MALILISAVLAVAAYLQALNYPFVSDDVEYVTENAKLAGLHFAELWHLLVEPYNPMEFLPLRDLSYWFDIALFGLKPQAFRVHNIVLYLLCLPLIYATTAGLWRYFRPEDAASAPWAAAAVTALFAVHPAHIESVVWVSGRKDVLSGMFSMLALWLAMSAKREGRLSPAYAAAALIALLAAMLSKATTVVVAPIISILWLIFWRDAAQEKQRTFLLWPFATLLLAACVILNFSANSTVRVPTYFGIEAVTRALAAMGWLARLAVSPEGHYFLYPVFEDPWLPVMVALGAAVLVAALWGMVRMPHKRSFEGFVLVILVLLCMPYTHMIPFRTHTLISDRFLFLAVWPALLLVVALAWRLKPVPRAALLLAIALPLCFQTAVRPHDWRSAEALMNADLRAYPGHYMAAYKVILVDHLPRRLYLDASKIANTITDPAIRNIMLGIIMADYAVRVKATSTGQPQEAMAILQQLGAALKQQPAQTKWNPPMEALWTINQRIETDLWESLSMSFLSDGLVSYNAGLWMMSVHQDEEAVIYLRGAVKSKNLPEALRGAAFRNLGLALVNSGQVAEAKTPLLDALAQQPPDRRAYCSLSEVYKRAKQFEEAARAEAMCPRS